MSRCGIYARYSSDRQSPASIEDQVRRCKEYADRERWEVLSEHIYKDEELSGVGSDRPGWTKLRSAMKRNPRPFDVLLVDDTSRLNRNLGDNSKFLDELNYLGVRVIAVSQGIDSQNKQSKLVMTFHGLADEMYIDELADKTHRGLEGRALKGLSTGGRTYGYDSVPVPSEVGADGVAARRRQINKAEAAVVLRIFEMYADGGSLKGIAKTLNAEHLPPPRKRRGRQFATWCPSAIREMLRRELYIGRIVWNRRRYMKRPDTNKRVSRKRPETEWTPPIEAPELRIIPQDLWERVQNRIAFVAKKYNFGNCPGLAHRASTSPNLLTGLMKCGVCGANLIIVTGRGKNGHHRYGCPQHFNRGACTNGLKERADVLEKQLLSELQNAVLRPDAIEYVVQEFERNLQSSLAGLDNKIGRMRQRAEELKHEIASAVRNLIACNNNPTLVQAINTRQQELDEITRQLLSTEPDSVSAEIGRIRQFATGRLGDIRQILKVDVQKAKAELQKHISEIRMVPQVEGSKGHYVAEGEWNLLGGYGEDAGNPATKRIRMVAGEGFEPSTFGL
ncbi:MAG TPA: recombinase family protein [Candidatus Limnocylindrales bacterium]|nr:recombinase family protein [Candidatus Limnocylindrales bacterium]